MSDINNSAVGLPAGSFDYDALKSGLGKASRGAKSTYDDNVAKALNAASASQHTPGKLGEPGYQVVERQHEHLGVTEKIQVYVGEQSTEIPIITDEATVDASTNTGDSKSAASEKE